MKNGLQKFSFPKIDLLYLLVLSGIRFNRFTNPLQVGFKDASGKLYNRYILEIETFIEVASWTDSMENILLKAEKVIISPQKVEFVAVFNSEAEAFKCAYKLYPEFPLEEYIIEMYD